MATYYNHAQIGMVDANGNINVIYPETYGTDVRVEPNPNYKEGTNVQKVISKLGNAAFSNLSNQYEPKNPSTVNGYTQYAINEKFNGLATVDIPDYIIERGTSGIWSYVKYKSGYVEMWGYQNELIKRSPMDDFRLNSVTFPFGLPKKDNIPVLTFNLNYDFDELKHTHSSEMFLGHGSLANVFVESPYHVFHPIGNPKEVYRTSVSYHIFGKI